jgi:hypothetical protein
VEVAPGAGEREDAVEVDAQRRDAGLPARERATVVLRVHQRFDARPAVAVDGGGDLAHHVEQPLLEEEQTVDGTVRLALDQQRVAAPAGAQPRAPELAHRRDPAGRAVAAAGAVRGLDDATARPAVEEVERGSRVVVRELQVLRDGERCVAQQPVDGVLVQ